jgi:hypothetical protein
MPVRQYFTVGRFWPLRLRANAAKGQLRLRAVAQLAVAAAGRCQPTTSSQGEIRQRRAQFNWRRKGWWLIDRSPWAEAGCPGAAIKLEAG